MAAPLQLHVLATVLAIVVAASPTTANTTPCHAYGCGNAVRIKYPFWVDGGNGTAGNASSSQCGYAGMRLECRRGTPVLSLPSGDYAVRGINYDERTLTAVDLGVSGNASCCPLLGGRNLTLPRPLSLTNENTNITVYSNCSFIGTSRHMVPCMESADGDRHGFVFEEAGEHMPYPYSTLCEGVAGLPVLSRTLPNSTGTLIDGALAALSSGFELRWSAAAGHDCSACEDGDGWCGQCRDTSHGPWRFCCLPRTALPCSASGGGSRTKTALASAVLAFIIFL